MKAFAVTTCVLVLAACGGTPELGRLPPDAVVLAFGDSITSGAGAAPEESYPSVLADLTGRRVINAGVPGEISAGGLARLGPLLREHDPALLILCHGGNDLLRRLDPREMAENLRQMAAMARERGTDVLLVGVPAPGIFLTDAELYRRVAEDTGALYEGGLIGSVLRDGRLKSDAIHPNAAGYRKIAEHIASRLRSAGAL